MKKYLLLLGALTLLASASFAQVDTAAKSQTLNADPGALSAAVNPVDAAEQAKEAQSLALENAQVAEAPVAAAPSKIRPAAPNGVPMGVKVTATAGNMGPTFYATLKLAFDEINAGTHQGAITIGITSSTTETASAVLNSGAVAPAAYTSVSINPVGGAQTITGSIVGAVIKLNGADNVTIDGRIGGVGTARSLSVINTANTSATAAIWLASVAAGNGASNNIIRNLELATGIDTSASGSLTYGITMNGGATPSVTGNGLDNDNNQFIFNRIIKARYGIVTRGTTTDLSIGTIVTDNIIGPSAFGTDQISKVGILMQADTGALVSRNTVQFVGCLDPQACNGADRMGIAIGNESWGTGPGTLTSNTYTVTRNVIHDIIEETTFSAVGLNLATTGGGAATNNLVANNFIYNVRANGTAGDQAVGIGIAGGHTDSVVFNSILMSGDVDPGASVASTNFGSGIRIGQANGTTFLNLTLKNNSVYMDLSSSSGPTVRYYAISGNTAAYSFGTGGENNNNYYINPANPQLQTGGLGTVSGVALTNQFATLANWQAAYTVPQDGASIQADPQYLSSTDLHIAVTSPNVDMGVNVGVNTDIDGQLRVPPPDIGADEPSGITPPPNDIAATAINTPANGSLLPFGSVTPKASFQNQGTATQTNVMVQFTITGPMGYNYSDTQVIASIAPDQTMMVTFAAAPAFTNGGSYNMAATVTTPDATPGNDQVVGSFTVLAPLAGGTYSVPGNFPSLTNPGGIFAAINTAGVTGNITINIVSDLTGETGVIPLNEVVQAGPSAPTSTSVTIKPGPGNAGNTPNVSVSITGSSATNIIRINGADNVTIDGSDVGASAAYAVGGDPSLRKLTIQNTNAAATGGAVIAVTEGTNGAQNFTIKNTNVLGQDPTQTLLCLHIGGNSIGTSPLTANNINARVENCSFQKAILGVFDNGISAANPNTGNVITMNDLSATGANRLRRGGLFFFAQNGIQVTANSIGGISSDEGADAIGIIAGNQNITTTAATSGGVSNAVISGNKINGVAATSTVGFSAAGICIAGDPAGANTIYNNMITGITAPSTAPDLVAGIFVTGVTGSNTKVYYNSVALTGDRGVVASQIGSYALAITGATTPLVDLKNNIFYTTQTSGGGANAKSYVLGTQATTVTMANLTSDVNLFFFSGANAAGFRTGSLDATGTDFATLAAWQAGTGKDANSLFGDPLFVSPASDLHIIAGSLADNAAMTIPGITTDIDGEMRSATTPDIGADEVINPLSTTICHRRSVSLTLGANSLELQRHFDHGDTMGPCAGPPASFKR